MSHKKKGYTEDIIDFDSDYAGFDDDAPVVQNTKKKKKEKKNRGPVILGVILVLVLIFIIVNVVLSPSKKQCDQIIGQFEKACNSMDITGMVACMKPSLAKTVATVGSMAGTAIFSADTVNEFITNFVTGNVSSVSSEAGMQSDELFKNIRLEPKRYGLPFKTRKVRCKASFGALDVFMDFYITKVYGDPYIAKIRFVLN